MPATIRELGIDKWTVEERHQLVEAILESLGDEVVDANDGEFEDWEKELINERLALADANPEASRPAKEVFERLKKDDHDAGSRLEHPLQKFAGNWDDPAMLELYRKSLAKYRAEKDCEDGIEATDATIHH